MRRILKIILNYLSYFYNEVYFPPRKRLEEWLSSIILENIWAYLIFIIFFNNLAYYYCINIELPLI